MGQVRDTAELLYKSGALLGFAVSNAEGTIVHNESFFSDEAASQALTTLVQCVAQLATSGRAVNRLTVELDDVVVIYTQITDGDRHGMFILSRACDLDSTASSLSTLAA